MLPIFVRLGNRIGTEETRAVGKKVLSYFCIPSQQSQGPQFFLQSYFFI